MRMWMVDPRIMCRKHLLGEHVEIHMLVGTIARGTSIAGFVENGLIEPMAMESRHEALVREMTARGYNHKSPLKQINLLWHLTSEERNATVDKIASLAELLRRCPECAQRHTILKQRGEL